MAQDKVIYFMPQRCGMYERCLVYDCYLCPARAKCSKYSDGARRAIVDERGAKILEEYERRGRIKILGVVKNGYCELQD